MRQAVPSVVMGCLPACCGKMVAQRKILGALGIVLGICSWFMPLIGAHMGTYGACTKTCEDAECNEYSTQCNLPSPSESEYEWVCENMYNAHGIIGIFIFGGGGIIPLMICIIGVVFSAIACCGCGGVRFSAALNENAAGVMQPQTGVVMQPQTGVEMQAQPSTVQTKV